MNAGTKLPKKFSPSKDRSQSILIFFMFDISFKGLGSSESNSSSPQNFNELKEEQEDKNITRKEFNKKRKEILNKIGLDQMVSLNKLNYLSIEDVQELGLLNLEMENLLKIGQSIRVISMLQMCLKQFTKFLETVNLY